MHNESSYDSAIALIGMAGRFPGAHNIETFWQNIAAGVTSIRGLTDEELLAAGVEPARLAQPNYVKVGAPLEDIAQFDAAFFGYTPREAELMDPQHRLFLECAWEALEQAAYDPYAYPGLVGVFAGSAFSTYYLYNLSPDKDMVEAVGQLQIDAGNDRDSLASMVSYKLNLRGPALGVQTFCSTSLVAVHLACQSLLNYESDLALAGGVSLLLPHGQGYLYEEGGILSPDGVCRAFDQHAQGSVIGSGCGVVVLKRLQEAVEDGDEIVAVLRGSAINNDGSVRVSYTAPGVDGQANVILGALSYAGVSAESLSYIEAHGTGTKLGDAVELAAMRKAFAAHTKRQQFCAIGSVKPNVGHLDRASGVTGLIKACLALKHGQLPPSIHFEQANEEHELQSSPFYVNTSLRAWPRGAEPRRAGVSSFGLGGTNVHMVLEEAPEREPAQASRSHHLLLLSAKTESALRQAELNLANHLRQHPEQSLADIAYTLQVGRSTFRYRRIVVCCNHTDAIAALEGTDSQEVRRPSVERKERSLGFLLPGEDACYTGMGRALYEQERTFREAVDRCSAILDSYLGCNLCETLYSLCPSKNYPEAMPQNVKRAALFVVEYALAHLLKHWGIQPQVMVSQGCGEYVAASLSGTLSLEDALRQTVQDVQQSRQQSVTVTGDATLLSGNETVFLAIGTRQFPTAWMEQYPTRNDDREPLVLPALPSVQQAQSSMDILLGALGELWLAGVTLDWACLHTGGGRRRVPLPTYPFERQHYWIPSAVERQGQQRAAQLRATKRPDIADWFYQPVWKQAAFMPSETQKQVEGYQSRWLVFVDDCGLGEQLAAQLEQAGHTVIRVYAGTTFVRLSATTFTIRPGQGVDYETLCQQLINMRCLPHHVLHCWCVTSLSARSVSMDKSTFVESQQRGFYSLLYLAQTLGTHLLEGTTHISVISSFMQAVTAGDRIQPEKATVLGACKVIPQEYLNIACRAIDVDWPANHSESRIALLASLLREITSSSTDPVVAYRNSVRWIQSYQSMQLMPAETRPERLRYQGVYVITGGLGNVGLALAEYLAQTVQARLVLVGRSAFPQHDEWSLWLESHMPDDIISQKIRRLQALEATGIEVLLCQADVAEVSQMEAVFARVEARFGQAHGVIHAAGITSDAAFKTIQYLDPSACEVHFQPKVYGLLSLELVLRERSVDFCLVFSSLAAVLGGLSLAAYAAANICMDAFVHSCNETKTSWISVNWDTWQFKKDIQSLPGATITPYAMSVQEGTAAFARVLATHGISHVVNSTGDLSARIRRWILLEALREKEQPETEHASLSVASLPSAPQRTDYERLVRTIWQEVLGIEQVGLHENYFELGGNSLNGLQVIARLRSALHRPIPIVALFEAPTISALAAYLQPTPPVPVAPHTIPDPAVVLSERRQRLHNSDRGNGSESHDIAVIAMSGRFPGAGNIEAFWHNLTEGVEALTTFSDEQLCAAGVAPELLAHPQYIKARPVLPIEQVEGFDAAFFGYSPREAELLDPQVRLFLECSWEALERAGYDPSRYLGRIAVFGGANVSSYWHALLQNRELVAARKEQVSDVQLAMSLDKDALATTVSYKLNLRGPSLGVQTFCSTSLVAVHLAMQSLRYGECDLALAGGVSVRVPVTAGYRYQEGGQESRDGHCRPFDADASGSIFGDGAGIIVLKRLSEALADGDVVLAVLKGSAINNDGSGKVSYAAPSVGGQAAVVQAALADARVAATSLSYVEAHGTATILGDPIEVRALSKAFAAESKCSEPTASEQVGWCGLGSVKSNVGHLDRAAGVTGLIKTVLALRHEVLPPTLHYQKPNPALELEQSPFVVVNRLTPWRRGTTPRRAGVNALGMGGTNAHVVVEEAPEPVPGGPSRPWQFLPVSARTESALEQVVTNLISWRDEHQGEKLADVAYSLQVGRQRFAHRRVLLCQQGDEVMALNQRQVPGRVWSRQEEQQERNVVFVLPGIGDLNGRMVADLYEQEATFRHWVDHGCDLLNPQLGEDVYECLLSTRSETRVGHEEKEKRQQQTEIVQPATFVVEYALAQLLLEWGIRPQALLGYSLGEYVAACLAGVFSLEDALHVVAKRARLISEQPAGAMLAVALSEEEVQSYLSEQVSLAAVTAPRTCVLAGTRTAIAAVEEQMQRCELVSRRIAVEHALHSLLLRPIQAPLREVLANIPLHVPRIPYISSMTGDWVTEEQATDPGYWAEQMCRPVRFADGVGRLLEDSETVVLEVGIGQALCSFVKQHSSCDKARFSLILPTLPTANEESSAQAALLAMVGKLWLAGVEIDWSGFYTHERRQRVVLPTYPFERQRCWIDTSKPSPAIEESHGEQAPRKIPDITNWFFIPSWKQALPGKNRHGEASVTGQECWLVFVDACGIGTQVMSQLQRRGLQVVSVLPGDSFAQLDLETYTVCPSASADYTALLKALRTRGISPTNIVHMWSVTTAEQFDEEVSAVEDILNTGFYSLLALAQALGNQELEHCTVSIVSNAMQDVLGNEQVSPAKATILGPCRVIPQEYANVDCRSVDVVLPEAGSWHEEVLVRQLVAELLEKAEDAVIALRGKRRWVQCFEPVALEKNAEDEGICLRQGGVYLITGGLGGIGMAMASYLARTVQAKLVLVGRTGLPPRHLWQQLLAAQEATTGPTRQIRQILAMEAQGAEVRVAKADVADEAQMQAVAAETLATFGTINGVLHTAGIPGVGLIQLKTPQQAAQVLAPKIQGTLVLERVLRHCSLDFMALFSSVTSTTGGGPGQVDYSAANAFLDAFAHSHSPQHGVTIAIDWSEWQWNAWEIGLNNYGPEAQAYFKANRQRFGIAFEEGAEAFQRILAARLPHVVVSTQDFRSIAGQSKFFTATEVLKRTREQRQGMSIHPRPQLSSSFVSPGSTVERQIASLWEELLGIAPVGINDNFFELGGNSLMGIDLITRLRKLLHAETLAAHVLYEAPTVNSLAHYLEQDNTEEDVEDRHDRGRRRREGLKQLSFETRRKRL